MKLNFNFMKRVFNSLFRGMQSADKIIVGDANVSLDPLFDNVQEMESNNLYSNLLKGELTQEVIETRYKTYRVLREADNFEYIGNGASKRKNNRDLKIKLENPTDLEIILVQDNKPITETRDEAEKRIDWQSEKVNVSSFNERFTLNIERDFTPRFKLEAFATRLVVKKLVDNAVELNLYVSKYAKRFESIPALFLREIKRIIEENNLKSEILSMDRLWFITDKAYGSDDLKKFSFINIKYFETTEFDGSYVLKFIAETEINGEDLTSRFFDSIAAKKYEEKARKENNSIAFIETLGEDNHEEITEIENKINEYYNRK